MRKIKVFALFTVLACGAGVAMPGNAWAAFNVKNFSCTTTPFGVSVDVSGLGSTNLCVEGSVSLNLFCACVNNSGTCTSDPKKLTNPFSAQSGKSVEPKNGRVRTTFTLPVTIDDTLCTEPQCGSGQDTKLIKWDTSPPKGQPATFRVCTTSVAGGGQCSCGGQPILDSTTCGPTSDIPFPGKNNSCASKLP
jgi:hypothetical protein